MDSSFEEFNEDRTTVANREDFLKVFSKLKKLRRQLKIFENLSVEQGGSI